MITVEQLRQKAERKYWYVLEAEVKGETMFPLIIPSDKNVPGDFGTLRSQISKLIENSKEKKKNGYHLTFEERKTRKHGLQSLPVSISFDSLHDFLWFIGKKGEAERIMDVAQLLRRVFPLLDGWVQENLKKIAKHIGDWEGIVLVLQYFIRTPRPRLFVRELPIDVHTKFIQTHTAVLQELLEILIPKQVNRKGTTFEEMFYLKSPDTLVRFRCLDESLNDDVFKVANDLALPSGTFNRLTVSCRKVVIVENQMTYLTLPPMKNTIAIYGGGFQVEILKSAHWLRRKSVIYWGDIDAHGFLILSRVRKFLPRTKSIMMDKSTFKRFQPMCRTGASYNKSQETVLALTPSESVLFNHVATNNLRLEQEHISQEYIISQFNNLPDLKS